MNSSEPISVQTWAVFPICIVLCVAVWELICLSVPQESPAPLHRWLSSSLEKRVLPWKTWYPEKTLSGNFSLLVPLVSSVLGRLGLDTWGSPNDILHWKSCPALGPSLSTTPLSVTEHSPVSQAQLL